MLDRIFFNIRARKSKRTMPATLLTAVTTPQEIASGEDHQSILEVIILTLHKYLWLIALFHHLKHERRAGPAGPAGRAKAALEIFPVEEIINIGEEAQLPPVIAQR